MKWFKHFTDAGDDVKLRMLVDELGLEGLARYWLMIELLTANFDGSNTEFHIPKKLFMDKLMLGNKRSFEKFCQSLAKVWGKFGESLVIVSPKFGETLTKHSRNRGESTLKIIYPKILEIKDNYTSYSKNKAKKLQSDYKHVIKEEEAEEEKEEDKKSKAKKPTAISHHDFVFDYWNQNFTGSLGKIKLFTDQRKKAIRSATSKHLKTQDDWKNFLDSIFASAFLTGATGWNNCSFDWCLKPANMVKIIEGNYSNETSSNNWPPEPLEQTIDLVQNNPFSGGTIL